MAVINMLNSAMLPLSSILLRNMTDHAAKLYSTGIWEDSFIWTASLYILLFFLQNTIPFSNAFIQFRTQFALEKHFERLFTYETYRIPYVKFLDASFMQKYILIHNNILNICQGILNLLPLIFFSLFQLALILIIFIQNTPWLFFYAVIIFTIQFIVSRYIAKKKYLLSKEQISEERYQAYYKKLLTSKEFAKELRIFSAQSKLFKIWKDYYQLLKSKRLRLALKDKNYTALADLAGIILETIAILILFISALSGNISVGVFVMLYGLLGNVQAQVSTIGQQMSSIYVNILHMQDFVKFISENEGIQYISDFSQKIQETRLPYGEFQTLTFENVSFSYPYAEQNALENVSFSIKRGEIVSILGYNGSGKTTLSKLACGLFNPTEGTVRLNGQCAAGNPVAYSRYFGVGFQDYAKLSVSLKKNIAIGCSEHMNDEKMLLTAVEHANLSPLLEKLPMGLDTLLGKDYDDYGTDLSGGEWQKVILARAYMGEPQVLILDEPTASIDPLEELHMLSNLRKIIQGRTALLISHRIGFARIGDRIIMVQNGKIIEQGSHDELLKKHGYYAELFEAQKNLYSEEK
jgi:ABC-type multidrug transport system, ATPase and permease components